MPSLRPIVFAAGAVALVCPAAAADPHCMARVLADVPADEAPEQVKSKGNAPFGPIAQVRVDRRTGRMSYCARGSYCYGSNAFELVSPCRLKLDKSIADQPYFAYFTR